MPKLIAWAESHREFWFAYVRIYLGLVLLARGILLVFNIRTDFFVNLTAQNEHDWLLTGALLHYVALAHFVGSALLAIGLFTRIAALVQIPILAGAVFIVHRSDGLFALGQSLELSALVLFLLVTMLISGGGVLSMDQAMRYKKPFEPVLEI